MNRQSPLLEVENLSVCYGHVEAVRDVSFRIRPGEFVSIIGNNGAGKSSTLNAIAGVVKPAGGKIKIGGVEVQGLPAHAIVRRGISLVPEGRLIFADQTVMDNLLLGTYARTNLDDETLQQDLDRVYDRPIPP